MSEINKKIGSILKNKRREIGYSLEDVKILLKKEYKIDLDNSNISRYENGTVKNMNAAYLRALCKINNINYIPIFEELGYLDIKSQINSNIKSNVKEINEELIKIPVKALASAGNGHLNFEENIKTVIIRKNGFDSNCYLIEVVGNSMEPLIQDGSYIVVDPKETEIIDNKIYIIELNNQIYIKKVIKNIQLKIIILKSINPAYEDIYITEEMLNHFDIKGRAIKFILEGKL